MSHTSTRNGDSPAHSSPTPLNPLDRGMTKRELIAMHILAAHIAVTPPKSVKPVTAEEQVAADTLAIQKSVVLADELLEALDK